jgi:serine protease DegS
VTRAGIVAACALLVVAFCDRAPAQDLKRLQREFVRVSDRVIPATVIVRAANPKRRFQGSSGVIISPEGLVLSDADATIVNVTYDTDPAGQPKLDTEKKHHGDVAIIQMPAPDSRTFRARLIHRDPDLDVSLLEITDKVRRLPYCPLGDSDDLAVGSSSYVCGNSFGMGNEGKPALCAGVVSALLPAESEGVGHYSRIVTSAAVNPGNNGGPLVDLEGKLVGIVSTFEVNPESPFRGFGSVTPLRLILARFRKAALADRNLPDGKSSKAVQRESRVFEQAFQILARRGSRSVVSLVIDRGDAKHTIKIPKRMRDGKVVLVDVPRYPGPYSAFCLSADGYILSTSSNFFALKAIKGITAHLADGRVLPAKLIARDKFRLLALLRVEATDLPALEPAEEDDLEAGRFVLALGNPFGDGPHVGPLLTAGIVSAMHKGTPHMDAIQTDAGMNDANIGGPLIDLRGRLIGVNVLLNPERFGRNSGVGFAVPIWVVAKQLAELKAGRNIEPGYLGIMGVEQTKEGLWKFPKVVPDGPAHKGGLRDGDLMISLDGVPSMEFKEKNQLLGAIKKKRPGDILILEVRRGDSALRLEIALGARPEE